MGFRFLHATMRLAIAAGAMLLGAQAAGATTIDFGGSVPCEILQVSGCQIHDWGPYYVEDDFEFRNGNGTSFWTWTETTGFDADPTGHTLVNPSVFSTTEITKVGGGSFDWISIDLADGLNVGFGSNLSILGLHVGGGASLVSLSMDGSPGLQTFTLNLVGLLSATILSDLPFQMDNLVFDVPIAPVPVPMALPLFATGLGLLAAFRLRGRSIRLEA